MSQTEIWKDIPHFPGYQASTEGRIRSVDRMMEKRCDKTPFLLRGKVLKPIDNGNGYKAVNLMREGDYRYRRYYIHRLVLEWCTRSENNYHAYNIGLHVSGESHPQAKYSAELISAIKSRHANGERVCDLSREYGIPHQYVSGILNGKKRTHG